MPTFNQLVRKGREQSTYKSTAPALQKGVNTLKNRTTDLSSPQKRGVCTADVYKRQLYGSANFLGAHKVRLYLYL